MAVILDGRKMADQALDEAAEKVQALKKSGVTPGLAVILVGDDPASQTYVRSKGKACDRVGIYSRTLILAADTTQNELEKLIADLNRDDRIDGILLQLPLPPHLDEQHALSCIAPEKDVDGFHALNAGRLMLSLEGVQPCTPKGIMYMLRKAGVPVEGARAVVVGRSNIVGKPTALLLLKENATVTLCHSRTPDLKAETLQADILVAAVGKPMLITEDMVKPGAAVIDVGINRVNGRLVGDVDFENVSKVAGYISPVPGGVGLMTVAMLMDNVIGLAEQRSGKRA